MKLSLVIEELVEERGLDKSVLSSIICEGILAAYQRKYPDLSLKVEYDKRSDEIAVKVEKKVVSAPSDDFAEISLRKARNIDANAELDSTLWLPFEGTIGRIEILRAKQVIAQNIRQIETKAIYDAFKNREGTIVVGTVHKCESGGAVVKIDDDTMGFLPRSLTIPGEKCMTGYTIRALLKEVLLEPRNDNQLILDRTSPLFLQRLLELEIPEVYENLIEIKKIVRIPGYKSKVAVVSHDKNIDPVGTCVGVEGVRIKPIQSEFGGFEKIDVIAWSTAPEQLVKDSLKPAAVNRVEIQDDGSAAVWVDEDQRSLAIGKGGQNINLASQMAGKPIHLVQPDHEVSGRSAAEQLKRIVDEEDFGRQD